MPVDFAAVAARFAASYATQLRTLPLAQRLIATALTMRVLADRAAEWATADFPIVGFHDGAVSLMLAASTAGTLHAIRPPISVGAGLKAGGSALLDGLWHAFEPLSGKSQEGALARTFTALDGALTDIEASIRRFATPTPGMFDPAPRRAGDLFGLGALGWNAAVAASRPGAGADQFLGQVAETRGTLAPLTAGPEAGGSTIDRLDDLAMSVLAGFTAIAAVPWLVDHLIVGAQVAIRLAALEQLGRLERVVLDLRRDAFAALFGGLTDRAVYLVAAAHELIAAHIDFTIEFWWAYGSQLLRGVRTFVEQLGGFLGDLAKLLDVLPGWITYLTGFALKWWKFSVRLDDVLDGTGHAVNAPLRDRLFDVITAAELLTGGPTLPTLLARQAVEALFDSGGPGDAIPELPEAAPFAFHSDVPRLLDAALGDGRRERLFGILDNLDTGARAGFGKALTGARTGLVDLSAGFARDAEAAAGSLPVARLEQVGERSRSRADALLGDVLARARQPRDRPERALADHFEEALAGAHGGVAAIAEVIDAYVGGMAALWRARVTEGPDLTDPLTATSPLILRRHAVLGRVALPRLTLRVTGGQPLDEELADLVAARFAGAVRGAYAGGGRRLAEIAGR